MAIFNDYLLSCLPDRVQAKLRRLESEGTDAKLFGPAVAYLDMSGVWTRFIKHGVRPAHVIPSEPLPTGGYSQAVQGIRERLDGLNSQMEQVDAAFAAGSLTEAWRDVHQTDIGLARLALERIEESIICAAEDHGVSIERRADLDPAAFLEIERV